jgi:TonB family protein
MPRPESSALSEIRSYGLQNLARALAPVYFALALITVCAAQSPQSSPGISGGAAPPRANPDAPGQQSWREFIPLGGGFSILFPGTPESTKHAERGGDSTQFTGSISYTLETLATYSVTYGDYPTPLDDPATSRSLLDQFSKGVAERLNAVLISRSDFTLDNRPGCSTAWRLPNGKMLRGKAVIDGQRFFTIMVSTPDERGATAGDARSYEESAHKFLDSFKLLPIARHVPVLPSPQGEVDRYLAEHAGEVIGPQQGDIGDQAAENKSGRFTPGKVISRPEPAYPPIARAARAQGPVVVRVVADEEGKVVAAQAVSGHPLLQQAALQAARKLRFKPPLVDGKPVKFSGTITYTFRP